MKKYLLMIMLAATTLLVGCEKNGGKDDKTSETIKVSLLVSDIADNQATIDVSLTKGTFYGAKLVEAVNYSTVTIDPTDADQLANYVIANGVEITVPYTNTLTGLKADVQELTAVVAFDADGNVASTAYSVWTTVGDPWAWSDENNAGNLQEREW